MESSYRKSRAWVFIAFTAVALLLFVINATTLIGQSDVLAADPAPLNVPLAFLFACMATLFAIAANVSAFLNPHSTLPMKIISPFSAVVTALIIVPIFVMLGLTMTR